MDPSSASSIQDIPRDANSIDSDASFRYCRYTRRAAIPLITVAPPRNPLKNIPPNAFTIIRASYAGFPKGLTDIPVRSPAGGITYINTHPFVPLLMFKEKHQDRLNHLVISTLPDLLTTIVSDRSAILFIEYHPAWFGVDRSDLKMKFNEVC
jgi:hypothetical protein